MFTSTDPADPSQPNPLNWAGDATWTWTTVNTAETLIGVLTPLAWAFWEDGIEAGMRQTFYDFGVATKAELDEPPPFDQRYTAVFCGRYAVSVNALRRVGDRMMGTDGDAIEEQLLGSTSSGIEPQPEPRRYPIVAAKMPVSAATIPKRLHQARADVDSWWAKVTGPDVVSDTAAAADRFAEARARFGEAMALHGVATMLAQAAFDQVKILADGAGFDGLERRLVSGYGDLEETAVATDLWAVSRNRLTMDEFLVRHGYHGPREGRVDSNSWRQDPTPLQDLVATYRTMPDNDDPANGETARAAERTQAEEDLMAALSFPRRLAAKSVLGFARRHVPLREVGKALFLHVIDAGRAAAHSHGQWLVDGGHIDELGDVFYLNAHEVESRRTEGLRPIVAARKAQHEEFSRYILPATWQGVPEPILLENRDADAVAPDDQDVVEGLPVTSGRVEGLARVILDPAGAAAVQPGEILVCETTDPSWAPFFMVADALVIDIGGVMSHGAIVARELGVPCVINTGNGTRRITDGDLIRVDGDAGTVHILNRAGDAAS